MTREIVIQPVTKIEGHAKIRIQLDERGNVKDTYFHVIELRAFEKFLEGRPVEEAPQITTRICGICPVSHHLASAKAADAVFRATIPETAKKLRELMHMGQYIHSHSLHFLFLAAPDLIFGPDANPKVRNVVGLAEKNPELAKKAIRIRGIGQRIVAATGGKAVHPVTAVPGGVTKVLTIDERDDLLKEVEEASNISKEVVNLAKQVFDDYKDAIEGLGITDTYFLGMTKEGANEIYDGLLRMMIPDGRSFQEFEPKDYLKYLGEHVEPWSYLKFPYYREVGWPKGVYRVGPLARINVSDRMATPEAQKELREFRRLWKRPAQKTLLYHYARLIELVYAIERANELLQEEDVTSERVRIPVEAREGEGVGVVEAPRGTLIHHYVTNKDGFLTSANLIVATGQNNAAINTGIKVAAKDLIKAGNVKEGLLNRVEMVVRAYDPCLSCATHTIGGRMPLAIEIYDPHGKKTREIRSF